MNEARKLPSDDYLFFKAVLSMCLRNGKPVIKRVPHLIMCPRNAQQCVTVADVAATAFTVTFYYQLHKQLFSLACNTHIKT